MCVTLDNGYVEYSTILSVEKWCHAKGGGEHLKDHPSEAEVEDFEFDVSFGDIEDSSKNTNS